MSATMGKGGGIEGERGRGSKSSSSSSSNSQSSAASMCSLYVGGVLWNRSVIDRRREETVEATARCRHEDRGR